MMDLWSCIKKLGQFGDRQNSFNVAAWLFVRVVGACLLIAFLSLDQQLLGLLGSRGIAPVRSTLQDLAVSFGQYAPFHRPSLFWLDCSDGMLVLCCKAGELAALCAIAGVMSAPALLTCFVIYLSFVNVGSVFLDFQWDHLILETTLLAAFLLPFRRLEPPWTAGASVCSLGVLWLLRWLLLRVMIVSGVVKLLSGCPLWRNMTAVTFFFQDQLLPTHFAWYAHQLPLWCHSLATGATLFIEIIVPLCMFAPHRVRSLGAVILIVLQCAMMLVGDHGFINLLTIALCFLLIDDAVWLSVMPHHLGARLAASGTDVPIPSALRLNAYVVARRTVVLLVLFASLVQVVDTFDRQLSRTAVLAPLFRQLSSYGLTGRYGLYPWVQPERTEIVIEGSYDRVHWLPYEFRYHIGDPGRAPPMVTLYQPRLDWRMRFAALDSAEHGLWFDRFLRLLLAGSPPVLSLIETNPFPAIAPAYVRASLYEYSFTNSHERNTNGEWWHRRFLRFYSPPIALP